MKKDLWKIYKGKKITLIVMDVPYPRSREGILKDYNETHFFLEVEGKKELVPFLISTIKRIELK